VLDWVFAALAVALLVGTTALVLWLYAHR